MNAFTARLGKSTVLFAGMLATIALSPPAARAAEKSKIIDGFIKACQENDQISEEQLAKVTAAVAALRDDEFAVSDAITAGLSALYPEYQQALFALAQDDFEPAVAPLTRLAQSKDTYLAADASFFLGRAHIRAERYREALTPLVAVTDKWADKSLLTGEALFLRGISEARLLRRDEAIASLDRFIKQHPYAPERMKVAAQAQLDQLRQFKQDTIVDVFQRMDFVRRRLAQEQSDLETREQQQKIVDILAKLIKEAEEQECNGSGSGEGEGSNQSKGEGGDPGEGEGEGEGQGKDDPQTGRVVKRTYRGPTSPWSRLRDKQRDPAYSAIKEKFPARYEKLIEQYYKSFQAGEE